MSTTHPTGDPIPADLQINGIWYVRKNQLSELVDPYRAPITIMATDLEHCGVAYCTRKRAEEHTLFYAKRLVEARYALLAIRETLPSIPPDTLDWHMAEPVYITIHGIVDSILQRPD